MHAEIRTRLRVVSRVKSFMSEHYHEFGAHLQAGAHRQMLEHEKYFDFNRRSNTSLQIWKDYGSLECLSVLDLLSMWFPTLKGWIMWVFL